MAASLARAARRSAPLLPRPAVPARFNHQPDTNFAYVDPRPRDKVPDYDGYHATFNPTRVNRRALGIGVWATFLGGSGAVLLAVEYNQRKMGFRQAATAAKNKK
jgi:hypothetical protein